MDTLAPNLAISVATVLGMGTVIAMLWARRDATLSHVRRLMWVAAVFYAARGLDWVFRAPLLEQLERATAAMLPLMLLLVIESFMRQHAPRTIKVTTAAGSALFAVGAFTALVDHALFMPAMLAFQLIAFTAMFVRIVTRDRALLSDAENSAVSRLGFVLLILLPLVISDYRNGVFPVPLSMSGLAMLIGCWVLIHLHERHLSRSRIAMELAMLAGFSLIATCFVAWHLRLDARQAMLTSAMIFAFSMAAANIIGALRLRWRTGPMGSVTRGLAIVDTFDAYLADLSTRNLGCHILPPQELSDFAAGDLIDAFDCEGTLATRDLPVDPSRDTMAQSQMRTLLQRFGASRAYLVARDPLHIAIGQRRGMTERPDAELLAAFGLARLFAERDQLRTPS